MAEQRSRRARKTEEEHGVSAALVRERSRYKAKRRENPLEVPEHAPDEQQ